MNNELIRILASNFSVDFKSEDSLITDEQAFMELLKRKLSERIKFFIRTDLDKLLQALYRIDVDDRESNQAFDLGEINQVSDRLAELVIARQVKKLQYSQNYDKNRDDKA